MSEKKWGKTLQVRLSQRKPFGGVDVEGVMKNRQPCDDLEEQCSKQRNWQVQSLQEGQRGGENVMCGEERGPG